MVMALILEVPIALTAVVLSVVSLKTLKTIKHLGIGKSFWVPTLFSGIFFLLGAIAAILGDLGFTLTPYTAEVISGIRFLALCFLTYGVYTYSRKITKSLGEKLSLSAKIIEKEPQKEAETPSRLTELLTEKRVVETEIDCKHQLGYLRTLPRRTHIPEECLGCHQIIECKYSVVKKSKNQQPSPEMTISDANLEEETTEEK